MTDDSVVDQHCYREFRMRHSIACLVAMLIAATGSSWAAPAMALEQPLSQADTGAERSDLSLGATTGNGVTRAVPDSARVLDVLRQQDTLLYRSAFQAEMGSAEANADLVLAAQGNAAAALRTGRIYCSRSVPQPQDVHRCIGWLQLAYKLGNADAAYELALQFRQRGQPLLASNYEARAAGLGYVPPRSLDQIRK